MSRTVTATQAKNNFGELLRWTKDNKGGIFIKQYGEPTAVVVGIEEFRELQRLQEAQRLKATLAEVERIKRDVWEALPDELKEIDAVQMYIEAGFSEEVARETAAFDEQLKQMK